MRRKPILALVAASSVLVPALALTSSASAAVSTSSSKYFLQGGSSPVKDIKVSGYDGKSVYVAVRSNTGFVSVSKTTGLSLPFGYSSFSGSLGTSGSIAFTGSQADVNAALATLQLNVSSTSATSAAVSVTVFDNGNGLAYNPANAHFYKFVPGKVSGNAALVNAENSRELGLSGYLASITSEEENEFVATKLQGSDGTVAKNVWIGARDADTEGDWVWKGGPDNGVQFWKGCRPASGGAAYEGRFSSWAPGEPNNWNSSLCQVENSPTLGEDCAIINKYSPTSAPPDNAFFQKLWNDLPCSYGTGANDIVAGYVVEFGNKATGGDFSGVDFVTSTLPVAVPAARPTFLDRLFNLFRFKKTSLPKGFKLTVKKPKTKTAPAQTITCPQVKKTRLSYTLLFTEPGRYSFYFTDSRGKRIPMECGTKIKSRTITGAISAPVIQSVKDNERPVITAYMKTSSVGSTQYYPLLNVILKRTDGTLVRQDQPNPPLKGTPIR
jgi:hypothetical protein